MKRKQSYFFLICSIIMLAGCMVGGKYSRPPEPAPISYPDATNMDTSALATWFNIYHDTALQTLIKAAIDSNRDLLAAAANMEVARALSGVVKANLYPHFGYQAEAGGGSAGTDATKIAGGVQGGLFNVFGVLNWELDIWGKLRHQSRSAIDNFLSSKANRDALQVSLVAEVATDYFLLRDLDNELTISESTLAGRKENTKIIKDKFEHGYVSELDLLQAQQQEAIAGAAVPSFRRQIIQVENAIRVLIGMGPGTIVRGASNYDQILSPDIPVGIPSQLLERRPDIIASEFALKSQFEQIGVAEANRFPTISLTGALGFASPQLSSLLTNKGFVANGFGSLVGPLFNFGQNKQLVEVQRRQTEVLYYQYQQTTLNAFADVDNALGAYRNLDEEHAQRKLQVDAATKALMLSQARYDNGYTSYLEVIIMQTNLFDAQLLESSTLQLKLNSIVSLYKALGGGWN
ncbi:MAG TPA: efflux transporter outer membrane subunit [Puia sp.]|jgi:multidrug efflux system outer membrane protein|nr:efflux transporter outer membrane subunit [Puia sp.]